MHYKEKTVNILDVPVAAVDLDETATCIKKWIERLDCKLMLRLNVSTVDRRLILSSFLKWKALDMHYIDGWSLWFD